MFCSSYGKDIPGESTFCPDRGEKNAAAGSTIAHTKRRLWISGIRSVIIAILLTLATVIFTSCGGESPAVKEDDPIIGGESLTAKDGEPANGFLWENNFSEITVTGYQGASNDLKIPEKINEKPVTKIEKGAFSGFSALNSVEIPGTVKTIEGAFKKCEGLTSAKLGKGIENINSAFSGCSSLTEVNIPGSVTTMERAFEECKALKTVAIPDSVTNMNSSFSGCSALETANIPTGVTELSSTFSGCTSLKSMDVPGNVTSLTHTFNECTALTTVTVAGKIESMTATFRGCTSLVDVQMKGTVKSLSETFYGCSGLKVLTIPEGTTGISNAFDKCSSLEEITLPESYTGEVSLPFENLKTAKMSQSTLDTIIEAKCTDSSWRVCNANEQEKYEKLMTNDRRDILHDKVEIENSTYCYSDSMWGNDHGVTYISEDTVWEGIIGTNNVYFDAWRLKDNYYDSPCVICKTETIKKGIYIRIRNDVESDSEEGNDNEMINRFININGTDFPLFIEKTY